MIVVEAGVDPSVCDGCGQKLPEQEGVPYFRMHASWTEKKLSEMAVLMHGNHDYLDEDERYTRVPHMEGLRLCMKCHADFKTALGVMETNQCERVFVWVDDRDRRHVEMVEGYPYGL